MVALLLLTLLQVSPPPAKPQPPSPTSPNPTTQATKPKPRPRPSGATTNAMFFITDPAGSTIEGVTVTLTGPVDREATSPFSGPTRVQGLRAGTYRARFSKEGFITFEKELTWRAGTAAPEVAVTLNPAPEAPEPPPAPEPARPAPAEMKLPPPGSPKTLPLIDYIENNLISNKEPHKENLIGCSGVGQALLWQIRDPWTNREHESADVTVYVIAGEGTLKLGDRDVNVTNGSFAVVPRGTSYGLTRRGRNPLIVLAVLSGAPCAVN
jgi:hypothetical protein